MQDEQAHRQTDLGRTRPEPSKQYPKPNKNIVPPLMRHHNLYPTIPSFNDAESRAKENICEKEKMLLPYLAFSPFPKCFLPYQRQKLLLQQILLLGKELKITKEELIKVGQRTLITLNPFPNNKS